MNRLALALPALLAAGIGMAHNDGTPHHDGATPADVAADRPYLDAQGRLLLPKPVQHRLAIRTRVQPDERLQARRLAAEVQADPAAAGLLTAPEPGRLEAVIEGRWPLPGQRVAAGEVLAVLRPQLGARERAERRTALAGIEQKLTVARINAERLRLQAAAQGAPPTDNVYLEQADAEFDTQQRLQRLARESLDGRVLLRAPRDGVLLAVSARPGDVIQAGAALFQVHGGQALRVAAYVADAEPATRLRSASLRMGEVTHALRYLGAEPQPGARGWRLLFALPGAAALTPGQPVPIDVQLAEAPRVADCGLLPERLWVHVEPEVFEPRERRDCRYAVNPGERVVSQGAAALDAYLAL